MKKPKSLIQLLRIIHDEKSCRELVENIRWQGNPICPHCHCQSEGEHYHHYKLKSGGKFNGLYKCRKCRKKFSVITKSMFANSNIPLGKWLYAIFHFLSNKKGMSSVQLSKNMEITQKTAWFMLHRIRHNLGDKIMIQFGDMTQIDETYVGGKTRFRYGKDKKIKGKKGTQGRSLENKIPVMGLLCNGMVYTQVVPDTRADILKPIIYDLVKRGSIIITDGYPSYIGLDEYYIHKVVDHKRKIYVKDGYHINSLEGFWSHLKRSIKSTYHFVLPKYLQKYCDESAFRYNTRDMGEWERFTTFISTACRSLSYWELSHDF